MKRIITVLFATGLLAALATGCKEEYKTYSDAEYVLFADTLATYAVLQDQDYFSVPVSSTVACDYDRTFGVEIIDQGRGIPPEDLENVKTKFYKGSNSVRGSGIGSRKADVQVRGLYDNIEDTDSLGFILKLVMPEQLKWDLYHDRTKVVMQKSCPYDINEFTGWCVVTSTFLNSYPGVENKSIQRLIRTEKHPTEENMIILHDWLFSGYDVTIRLDPGDPIEPLVTMDKNQVLADEASVFGQILGDNKILVPNSPLYDSYFNSCQHFVALWIKVHVEDMGVNMGLVGHFYNIIEWVSDEEAERLQREEGMLPGGVTASGSL